MMSGSSEAKVPKVGQIIGEKYRLERVLGQGGMGAVYEAVHIHIGSRTAIKFLHTGFSENREAVQRFQREAQAAAAIGHESIIKVHDIGVSGDGSHYLVLEYLNGQSLGDMIAEQGPQPVETTAYIACQMLSGLSAAHAAGIVHRDLKPDNVYLVNTGAMLSSIKLLDFGISRVTGLGADEEELTRLTRTGIVLGTPAYMSPEHARGQQDIDARSDIFSVGIILYEMLTGELPFDGPNYNSVLAQILTDDPPLPSIVRPDLPRELEAVVMRAMTKDRNQRHQSARELFDDLLPFVNDAAVGRISLPTGASAGSTSGITDHDSGPPTLEKTITGSSGDRSRLWTVLVVAGALVALISGGAWGWGWIVLDAPDEAPSTSPDPALVAATPTPTPPPDEPAGVDDSTVTIAFSELPEGATVYIDDAPVPELPMELNRSGAMRVLKIEAEGHETFKRVIIPREDQVLEVELRPEAAEAPERVGSSRRERPVRRVRPSKRSTRPRQQDTAQPYRVPFID